MNRLIKGVGLAGAMLALVACTTMQSLPPIADQLQTQLKAGDTLEITTTGGQYLNFILDSADAAGLHGAGQTIAYRNIQSISRKEISAARTTLLVLGVVAAGAALAGGGGGGGGGGY